MATAASPICAYFSGCMHLCWDAAYRFASSTLAFCSFWTALRAPVPSAFSPKCLQQVLTETYRLENSASLGSTFELVQNDCYGSSVEPHSGLHCRTFDLEALSAGTCMCRV